MPEEENKIEIDLVEEQKVIYKNDLVKNWNKLLNLNRYSKIYVINCLVLIVLVTAAVTSNVVFNTLLDIPSYSSFVSSCNLIVASVIILYFALDAIFRENEFQMILFIVVICSITLAMLGNTIYNTISLVKDYIDTQNIRHIIQCIINLAISVLVIISQSTFIALALPIYRSFGWKIFKVVGTDRVLIRCFQVYNLWVTILKADIALTIDLSMLNLAFAPSVTVEWLVIVSLFIIFHLIGTFVVLPLKIFAAKNEYRILFLLCMAYWLIWTVWLTGKTVQTVVFTFITGEAYQNPWRVFLGARNAGLWSISVGFSYLYMGGLSAVNVVFRVLEFILAIMVFFNFGKGLKDIFKDRKKHGKDKAERRNQLKLKMKKAQTRAKKKRQRDRARSEMQRRQTVMSSMHSGSSPAGATPDMLTPKVDGPAKFINNDFSDSDDDASEDDKMKFTDENDISAEVLSELEDDDSESGVASQI